ncbi:MAG: AAA family ATPase [Vicinamibacterales bacterium]
MYESFYGLRERPFDLSPDPRFLFLSKQHTEALTHLQYGLTGRPGVTVLIGEAGTGKTTLIRKALEPSPDHPRSRIVQLSNPTLTRVEFYEYLAREFGFSSEAGASKPRFLAELEAALLARSAESVIALVVDEAQSLPHELLEEIRLLTNLQTPAGDALTVALVGQPELAARLNEGRLRQLKQRVALRCELAPLDQRDTLVYVAKRIAVAGGAADQIFTRAAIEYVHRQSRGIPRVISVICDNALISGLAANTKPVGTDLVEEVCRDFQIGESTKAPPKPTPAVVRSRPAIFTSHQVEATPEPHSPIGHSVDAEESKSLFSGFSKKKRFSIF